MLNPKKAEPVERTRPTGLFCGVLHSSRPRDVIVRGEGHIAVIAAPGLLKTMSIVVTSLLNGLWPAIVLDRTGEIVSICQPALESAGIKVAVMSAVANKVETVLGRPINDAGINVCSALRAGDLSDAEVLQELQKIAMWVIPDRPQQQDGNHEFFVEEARELIVLIGMHLWISGRPVTLPEIRKVLMLGIENLKELFYHLVDEHPDAFEGGLAELCQSHGGVFSGGAAPQAAGAYRTAAQWMGPYAHYTTVGRHHSGSDWDPSTLKDTDQPTVLFLVGTLDTMRSTEKATTTSLAYLLDTIATGPPLKRKVTVLLDECGSLHLTSLPDNLLFFRKYLRVVTIWQSLEGQGEKNFGRHGLQQILAGSRYKLISGGTTEPSVLRMFSELCGTRSYENVSLSNRQAVDRPLLEFNHGVSHQGAPLIRPEEIQMLGSDRWLMHGGDVPAMIIDKVPYWKRPEWLAKAGPSPFYQGD